MNRQPQITAAYERLSRDDELQGPSNSIVNQQQILTDYAAAHHLPNLVHFQDDGYSGTRWDRPGFTKLMDEIEAGNVAVLLCKDTSRLGRDYLLVGLFMETLRQKGVRLIALGDNVDTADGEDDFMPFRAIIHEWYARDTSRKIKAIYKSKGMNGKHTASHTLYGYIKSVEDKNQWLVDTEAAEVVRRIFRMTIEGLGPTQIATILEAERVPSPSYYLAQKGMGNKKNKAYTDTCVWYGTTVGYILGRVEYMGHMVNFKTFKANFKDKQRQKTPEDKLVVFENTHEPIIDPGTWETANRIRRNTKRRRPNSLGAPNPLTGLMVCADCGAKLYNERGYTSKGKWKDIYICSNSRKHAGGCTGHRINTATVNALILDTLRAVSEYALSNEAEFTRQVNEMFSNQQAGNIKAQRKKMAASQRRHSELNKLIQRVYEDMVAERITGKRFEVLSTEYEREQAELAGVIAELQSEVDSFTDSAERAAGFLDLTRRYKDFTELTAPMLHEFVRRIAVCERAEPNKRYTSQKVKIYLNFIEEYAPPTTPASLPAGEPDPAEAERERKRQYHSDYYYRRKANGGNPLTPPDTRTPEQKAEDEAAKREYWKAYNRDYQREYQRKKAKEKRAAPSPGREDNTRGRLPNQDHAERDCLA
jgi:DNA invertase Pin-like site-specific DNA recombinase